ncbi:MAG: hypothetical protein ACRDZ9_05970 [Acidimicrobiales bacterium]
MLAAAAVVAAVLVAGITSRDDVVDVAPADDPALAPTSTPTTTTPPPTGPSARAQDAARRWVQGVRAGDVDAGWAMLGPQSRDSIGGRAAFEDLMASALPEAWGPWASAEGLVLSAVPLAPPEEVWLVTFTGAMAQESGPRRQALPLAVRVTGGATVVEPFVPGPALDLIGLRPEPDGSPDVARGAPIGVRVDADAAAFVVAIDGRAVPGSSLERDGEGTVVSVRPEPPLPRGDHTITVGFMTPSGSIAAHAVAFRAG